MTKGSAFCTICLTTRKSHEEWFLLVENRWTDRLKILSWHDELVANPETHAACSATHVQLLVTHWMTTGTLDYPFARREARTDPSERGRTVGAFAMKDEPDISEAEVVAELAVHRDSIDRILVESPASLAGMLAALRDVLPEQVDGSEITERQACGEFVLTEA